MGSSSREGRIAPHMLRSSVAAPHPQRRFPVVFQYYLLRSYILLMDGNSLFHVDVLKPSDHGRPVRALENCKPGARRSAPAGRRGVDPTTVSRLHGRLPQVHLARKPG